MKILIYIIVLTTFIIFFLFTRKKESYDDLQSDYQPYMQEGKIIGGTVFSSYPDQVGGLGWII